MITAVDIRHASSVEEIVAAEHLLDGPAVPEAAERFVADPLHHMLIAYVDGRPAGMVTGVEMTHPDKGTEMFLYELGVDEAYRRRGIGSALAAELARFARDRGCYFQWVLVDDDNEAALATYRRAGTTEESPQTMLGWDFAEGSS